VVRIRKHYYKEYRREINFKSPGLLLSDEGINYVTHFGMDEIGVYMINGIRIAKEFGFLVPTKIRLDYEGIKNIYKLTQLGAIHIPNVFPMPVKEEPIEIISDDEADTEQTNGKDEAGTGNEIQPNAGAVNNLKQTDVVHYHHFEKDVTTALASIERPPALVCKKLFLINLASSTIVK
jgi:hypothetical protein